MTKAAGPVGATFEVRGIAIKRGGTRIVHGVDLDVVPGEITVLLGANGAGKTTLLEGLSGIIPVDAGAAALDGVNVLTMRRPARANAGLALVEQGRSIFPGLSVHENLLAAAPASALSTAYEVFPQLATMKDRRAELLSGGEQQMLVVARALVKSPRVLMLDEMSLGLAPVIVQQLLRVVRQLADDGLAVLLVEQFATLALRIGDRAAVLAGGTLAYSGACDPLLRDPGRLRHLYLATEPDSANAPA